MGSGKLHSRHRAVYSAVRRHILDSVRVFFVTLLSTATALAQPSGPNVVAGSAQVAAPSGTLTTVTQSSAKAIINWQDFSVAVGGTVQFNQPNSAAITLNRVVGANASSVEGAINANGQVWLLNPNGVLFGNGARINVGGLLATTSDIANQDFLSGNYNFSTGGNGAIVNNGAIRTAKGGSAVLSAPSVTNNGLISAQAGHVVLGGADTFTVDFAGDHLLSYAVGAGHSGKVSNTGTISAPGGQVLLTARAAADVADGVVNNSGMVEATSAREENGEIILDAGDGTAVNSGTLDASGKAKGATGGTVQVLGQAVQVTDGAKIDVSGDAGGGQVLIGGNFHGAGPQQDADNTTVGKAVITADAIRKGNGGQVAVWSNGVTQFDGNISAKGGAKSGDGGRVETSGAYLGVSAGATVVTLAPKGVAGNWLLDPTYIEIATAGNNYSAGIGFTVCCTGPTPVQINPASIVTALGSGNVQLQANTDLTVTDAITVDNAVGSGNKLVLQAGESIIVNAPITFNAGTVVLSANDPGAVAFDRNGGVASPGFITSGSASDIISAAKIVLSNDSNGADGSQIGFLGTPLQIGSNSTLSLGVSTQGASVFLNSNAAVSIDNDSTQLVDGASNPTITVGNGVNLTANGSFWLTAAGAISQSVGIASADLNVTTTGAGNTITLTDSSNLVEGSARFNADADVQYVNDQAGSLSATVLGASNITGGDLTVTAASQYMELFDNSGALQAANITLTNDNAVPGDKRVTNAFFNALPIATGNLTVNMSSTGGAIILGNFANNAVTGTVTLNGGSLAGVSFANTVPTTLAASSGPVDDLQVTVSDPSGNTSPGLTLDFGANNSFVATTDIVISAAGGIQNFTGQGLQSPSISLTSLGGGIGNIDTPIPISNQSGGTVSLGVSNLGPGGDTYLSSTTAVSIDNGVALSGGLFQLTTSGSTSDITVNSAIATSNNAIALLSDGSVILKSTVTDTGGTIFVLADQSGTDGPNAVISDPTGSGVLSAANVAMQLSEDSSGSGGIGALGSPVLLNAAGATTLNLEVSTQGAGVNLQSQAPVNISSVDSILGIQGVQAGNFTLNAAGAVSQDVGITANDLSVTTTGGGNAIDLEDSGNTIAGTARFNTAAGSDVTYNNADTNDNNTLLGSSSIGGNFTVTALNNIDIADGLGGSINVTGNTSLATSGNITQDPDIGILLATANLSASAGNAAITLDNPGNAISGAIELSDGIDSPGATLTNSVATTLGNTSINGGLTITVLGAGLTLNDAVSTPSVTLGRGDLTITAAGDVTQSIPMNLAGALNVTTTGNINLNSASNQVANLVTLYSPGDITFDNSVNTTLGQAQGDVNGDPANSVTITVGPASSGNTLTLTDQINASTVTLTADGDITTGGGEIAADTAFLTSNNGNIGSTIFNDAPLFLQVNTFAASTGGGDIVVNIQPLTGNNIIVGDGTHGINAGTGNILISSDGGDFTGSVGSAGAITASTLNILGNNIDLEAPNAVSGGITLSGGGNVIFDNSISAVLSGGNFAGGSFTLAATGDVTLASGTNVEADASSGVAIVLAASGNFVNNSGQGASTFFLPNGGVYQIYIGNLNGNTFGGVVSGNQAIWGTSYPTAISQLGNRYIFATPETLSVAAGNMVKTYGTDDSASLASDPYNVSGYVNAATYGNVFVQDNAANTLVGTPTLVSAGAAAGASVSGSPYAITLSGITLNDGYTFGTSSGTITVNPATLVYTANAGTRAYGAVNPVYTGTVTGFVNGDTQASATSGTLSFSTPALVTAGVGTYAINGLGLSANSGNYVFAQAAANANALTITPATLLYLANTNSRRYGAANPALTGSVTGFVNGDTQASVTTGTLSFATSATTASNVGSYAITGSGLSSSSANYVFAQGTGNATALTINPATLTYLANSASRSYGAANPVFSGSVVGFANGDTQASATSGTLSFTSTAVAGSGVGSYAINGSGLSAGSGNYVFAQAPTNATALTITPAILTEVLTGTVSKIFDGTTAATLSNANYGALSGVFGADSVSLASFPKTGTYDTAAIGTGKTVTVTGLSLTGAGAANYTIAGSASGAVGVILSASDSTTTSSAPVIGFVVANQNPGQLPPITPLPSFPTDSNGAGPGSPLAPPPPPPPPGPLADLTSPDGSAPSDTDTSDQTTDYVADSMNGGGSSGGNSVIIPGLLNANAAPPLTVTDSGSLSSWGNDSLWQ